MSVKQQEKRAEGRAGRVAGYRLFITPAREGNEGMKEWMPAVRKRMGEQQPQQP